MGGVGAGDSDFFTMILWVGVVGVSGLGGGGAGVSDFFYYEPKFKIFFLAGGGGGDGGRGRGLKLVIFFYKET